jgi:hypothetical protein
VRKPKGKKAQKTQMLRSMSKLKEKVIVKIFKRGCPTKTIKKGKPKKKGKRKGLKVTISQVNDSDSKSLKP